MDNDDPDELIRRAVGEVRNEWFVAAVEHAVGESTGVNMLVDAGPVVAPQVDPSHPDGSVAHS